MSVSAVASDEGTTGRAGASTHGDRFIEFHNANPHVYYSLVQCARSWRQRTGKHKVSIDYLFGILRWELDIDVKTVGSYKFNAAYSAYYARLIMYRCADLQGIFEVRGSDADSFLEANLYRCD